MLACIFIFGVLVATSSGSIYNSTHFNAREELFELTPIPHGAVSMAFVFDITGSMYDDLRQVIEGAGKILATTISRREKILYNYILVPFHDPEVGPVTVTTEPNEFQQSLRDLYVQGGGDCPEMSITAIKIALEKSIPNSFIYVFTDARAKDYSLTEEVLTLIQQKQCQVVFVMTGDCGDPEHIGFKSYEKIASTSSGQVFLLSKHQVNQVMNFVQVAVQSRKVNLVSVDRTAHDGASTYELNVDSKLQEFTISVSGEQPNVTVIDPSGAYMSTGSDLNALLSLKNALILNKKKPMPGLWKVQINAKGPHTVRITGLSSLDFVHGFSNRPTLHITETVSRPTKGITSNLLVNATELNFPGRINNVVFLDLLGNLLMELPTSYEPSHPHIYNISNFTSPLDYFYLRVNGIDESGFPFQRITPTAISAVDPEPPKVSLQDETIAYFGQSVNLTCHVRSVIPFTLVWSKDGTEMTDKFYYEGNANATLTVTEVKQASEGIYSCNASSSAGWNISSTFLDIKDPPPTIKKPVEVYAAPGTNVVLSCVASSSVDFNVTWDKRISESRPLDIVDGKHVILTNGSFLIKNVDSLDEGVYICRASNEGGFNEEFVPLFIHKKPVVVVRPSKQNYVEGHQLSIQCSVEGHPHPSVEWKRLGKSVQSDGRMNVTKDGYLFIQGAIKEDDGLWECVGTNYLGSESVSARLNYTERPTILDENTYVLVNNGDNAVLQCKATGIPHPEISWSKNGVELQELSFIHISESGTLTIDGTQEIDSGDYQCMASNSAGSALKVFRLDIGSSPAIVRPPQNQEVEILKNTTLFCTSNGKPPPTITWSKDYGTPIDFKNRNIKVLQNGALFIQNVQKEDEGMYTCSASNEFGSVEGSAYIDVTGIVKPVIAYSSPNLEVVEGRDATLSCIVLHGNPTPKIVWYKTGEPLNLDGKKIISNSLGSLQIKKVSRTDIGDYMCVAHNEGGNTTHVIKLDIQVPPSIADSPSEFNAIEGNSVRLPCHVSGHPKPIISWTRNGVKIYENDPHYFLNENGDLDIFNVRHDDTAAYSCTAINLAGIKEKRMTLFVKTPPSIVDVVSEVNVVVNNPVQLACEATGNPTPGISWSTADGKLSNQTGRHMFLPNGFMRISRVMVEDSGKYVCTASSDAGTAQKMITLNVQVPPRFEHVAPETMVVNAGGKVFIPCYVIGDPKPDLQWKKDLLKLNFQSSSHRYVLWDNGSLEIKAADVTDSGRYLCIAENIAGVVMQETNVIVHEAPSIIEHTVNDLSTIENNQVILPCRAQGTPIPTVRWFKNGEDVTHSNDPNLTFLPDGSLQIDYAKESHAGEFSCVAENLAGTASHHIRLEVFLPPRFGDFDDSLDDEDDDGVQNRNVLMNGTVILNCHVYATPAPSITWYKNGEELNALNEEESRVKIADGGRELVIQVATNEDTARYTCVAKNLAGEIERNFDLDVYVRPYFEDEESLQILSGIIYEPITINCPASGIPPPEIVWFKGEQLLTPGRGNVHILMSGRHLEISSLELSDEDRYTCIAKNPAGEVTRKFDLNVLVPAQIEHSSVVDRQEVIVNNSVVFHCSAFGIPLPDVEWYRDGEPIQSDVDGIEINGDVLVIQHANEQHSGKVTCKATNKAGEDEKEFILTILEVPHILREDMSLSPTVILNRTIILNCIANGSPRPQVVWLKNGAVIGNAPGSNLNTLSEGRQLRISNAALGDSGTYRCVASNKAGNDNLDFHLSVHIPASIDKIGMDMHAKVIVNHPKTFECPAVGIPMPKITWYTNGLEIVRGASDNIIIHNGGRRLEFISSKESDAGTIECKAENEAGSDHLSYELVVLVSPEINLNTSSPLNSKVLITQTTMIFCDVHGIPTPNVSWLHNGLSLTDTNIKYRLLENGQQLEIYHAEADDAGIYTCIAKNEAGFNDQDFVLSVIIPPEMDTDNMETDIKVIKGRSVTLSCLVHGIPFPNITWYKENEVVSENHRTRILLGGRQLEISMVDVDDAAFYTCTAVNDAGRASQDFMVSVHVPPAIDEANLVDNPKIIVNRTIVLECPVDGVPLPTVQWMKNDELIEHFTSEHPNDVHFQSGGRNMEIKNTQVTDSGKYTCLAQNPAGVLRRDFHLDVLVPPSIDGEESIENINVVENHTATFFCYADGIPFPSIMWFKGDVPLLDMQHLYVQELAGGREFKIRNVQIGDAGLYECRAKNDAGLKKKQFLVNVLVPPRMYESHIEHNIDVLNGHFVRLECNPSGVPKPNITWYKDYEPIQINSQISILQAGKFLQISPTTAEDSGKYVCEAKNEAGQSMKKFRVNVQIPPEIEDDHIMQEIEVINGDSVILSCEVSGVPEPTIKWTKNNESYSFVLHSNLRVMDGGKKLEVINTQIVDSGRYSCIASNDAGSSIKDFLVTVNVPTTIDLGPTEVVGAVNSRVVLMCETTGLPKPEVQWEKDGLKLPTSPGNGMYIQRTGSLQISSVKVSDTGSYRCIAKNTAGTAMRDIQLTVQVPPKIQQEGPVNVKAILGRPIELPCATSGVPQPKITWQKGTRMVTDIPGFEILSNGSIRIQEVNTKDSGIYICVAQNNAGTAFGQVRLEVQVPPSIDNIQNLYEVVQDKEVILPCQVDGFPQPIVTWEKDGRPLYVDDLRYRVLTTGWLAITQAREEDTGLYTCVAENSAGKANYEINVSVQVPPMIEEGERIFSVNEGETLILPCRAFGIPPPTISWIHDGKVLFSSNSYDNQHHLIINYTQNADAGSYVCTARNIVGRDSKEIIVKVYASPTFLVAPQNSEVSLNGKIELDCEANGIPSPQVYWKINDTEFNDIRPVMKHNRVYRVTRNINGRSKLVIDDASQNDEGAYTCVAENAAGSKEVVAFVKVKVPPKILVEVSMESVNVTDSVSLNCFFQNIESHPVILWTKNSVPVKLSEKIHSLHNGSLIIYDAKPEDEGEYKCAATNEAGSSEGSIFLTVRVPPQFLIAPSRVTSEQGRIVTMDCIVTGEPEPQLVWTRNEVVLNSEERVVILPNNSLRIVAAQLSDSDTYRCIAKNMMGFVSADAELTVQVHGQYSLWSPWSKCSESCGEGVSIRRRLCNNPEPANGGRNCQGHSSETRDCMLQSCPIDGSWTEWTSWNECSLTCGNGIRTRTRYCNNPSPQFGGQQCNGQSYDEMECNQKPCPVDGGWGAWSDWSHCSETCSEGIQERQRLCNNPSPAHGGSECSGQQIDRKACKIVDCEINGNWGSWTEWSSCTLSCGGGMRNRRRRCDHPPPSRNGQFCLGSDLQIDYCNKEDCPIHGNWAEWSPWGDCTLTCGGGQRRRFRTCTNPMPRHNGRTCIGSSQETDSCNPQRCAVDGKWSTWSPWTECSKSCDGGFQQRQRVCRLPLFGGSSCPGDADQMKKCNIHPCKAILPQVARANITGTMNGEQLNGFMLVNVSRDATGTLIEASIFNLSKSALLSLKPLTSILSPVYWTTATEVGKAANGFTLTQGNFVKESQVEFATGEILKMIQASHGINSKGELSFEVVLEGNSIKIMDGSIISIIPFSEDYIQDGPGSLYAYSSRQFRIDDSNLPYAWNHSVTYSSDYGKMPFLVQKLAAEDIQLHFDELDNKLNCRLVTHISKGDPSNQCPPGFLLDPEGPYCRDEDECIHMNPCSHFCLNNIGSYSCSCPKGYSLDASGKVCNDVDECELNTFQCMSNQQCTNTIGSYKCMQRCGDGFRRTYLTQTCEDINECQEIANVCDHHCHNMPGSYRCSCKNGFKLVSKSKCEDVNECESTHLCSHDCHNTVGSYRCSCPGGFRKASDTNCIDINECVEGKHNCLYGQTCQNKPGGFTCVNTCPVGFVHSSNGSCVDVDECKMGLSNCKMNQVCINTPGSFFCSCSRGFHKSPNNDTCIDINECNGNKNLCSYKCENTFGGFRCICPPGQKLLPDKKSCAVTNYNSNSQMKLPSSKCFPKPGGKPCIGNKLNEVCPKGYMPSQGKCVDIDECQKKTRCQHGCRNVPGSYYCICPTGYKLSPNKRTCIDIDECAESEIVCGTNQKCFNKRGDYECVDITCPPNYEREAQSGHCTLNCLTPGVVCPPGKRYKDVLEYHLIALPNGIPANRDLVRLVAYDQDNNHLPQTTFQIVGVDEEFPFAIRLENGKGVVHTLRALREKKMYKMKVDSRSKDHRRRGVVYNTSFMLYISVAQYPY